ncbi:MAG: BCD family MFS transporter [Anaerolineales bacterium]
MKRTQILRLGLFQVAAGGLSVLFLGVLNRVMRVELGLDLFRVTLIVGGGHYLGALIAIPFGYYSDTHPLGGFRRSFYVLFGAIGAAAVLAGSVQVVTWLAASPTSGRLAASFGFFLLEGIASYIAGTAFLALVTDLTSPAERGRVTGLIWTMLMVGIILTGVITGALLSPFSLERVQTMFLAAGGLATALAIAALVRQEKRAIDWKRETSGNLWAALRALGTNRPARWFAAFLFLSMFSYFMQDVILEPFGGEVFALSPAETTRFNAYMGVGVVLSMLLGGSQLIPRLGKRSTTSIGLVVMIGAFLGLAGSSLVGAAGALAFLILLLGVGAGFFTVGGVSLMMDMTTAQQTGLFVGLWTLIQALAKGPTAIAGGALQSAFLALGASVPAAYAAVFGFEAFGLALSILLLRQVAQEQFYQVVEPFESTVFEAMNS